MVRVIKNKRGSHVGIILSFGLFISFLIFMYVLMAPAVQTQKEQKALMARIKPEIVDRVSSNFTTMTIMNSSSTAGCFVIQDYNYSDMNSTIVKDENGSVVASNVSEGDLFIEDSGTGFYKVHSADVQLNTQSFSPSGCTDSYELGINRKEIEVSSQKAVNLIKNYEEGYDTLKDEFDIPAGMNFGVDFIYNNESRVETEDTNMTRNIYVEKFSTQYFTDDAEKKGGSLRVKIW